MTTDYEKLLRREGDMASSGAVVAPLLRMFIANGRIPSTRYIELPAQEPNRKPDGWFHPSTHPTMPARKLYYYLTDPDHWENPPFSPEVRESMLLGTLMHGVVRIILGDLGLWQDPKGTCPACHKPHGTGDGECGEPGVADPVLKRRGHMDGVLMLPQLGMVGYDLKTCNTRSAAQMPDMDLEYFRTHSPYYYGQMQDYMAMSGLRTVIVVFKGQGYPWDYREVHVPYDPQYVINLEAKYRKVRHAEAIGVPPEMCCSYGSKESKLCAAVRCANRH